MHWLASITQLAASILMTFLRAVVRRYVSQPSRGETGDPGFEIEWFITSLNNLDTASWLPTNRSDKALLTKFKDGVSRIGNKLIPNKLGILISLVNHMAATRMLKNMFDIFTRKYQQRNGESRSSQKQVVFWRILTENRGSFSWGKAIRQLSVADSRDLICFDGKRQSSEAREQNSRNQSPYFEVKNFKTNEGILELRRSLGELGNWKGPAYAEALSLSRAIEAVIDTFAPYLRDIGDVKDCHWTVEALGSYGGPDPIKFHIDKTPEGWQARTDELDSALSLWLYSVDDTKKDTPSSRFPSRHGNWARDRKSRHRCVQILGSYSKDLIRDLNWWMPNGLEGILEAQTINTKNNENSQNDTRPINEVHFNRIGRSGLRHLSTNDATKFHGSMWTNEDHSHSESQSQSIRLKWKDVKFGYPRQTEEVEGGSLLIVECQDSLANLYAKNLLSSFMWAFASHLKPFTVGRRLKATIESPTTERLPKSFALRSDELSHLVRRITSSTPWTEREIYLCILPSLSSQNNLPGAHAIVERALETVARDERDQNWLWVWEAYNWLFETSFEHFDPAHPAYLEAVAITLWFKEKVGQFSVQELLSEHDNQYVSDELRGVRKKFEAFSDRLDPRFSATTNRLWDLISLSASISPFLLIPDVEGHDTIWDDLEDLRFGSLSLKSPEYCSFVRPEDRRDVFWDTQLHRLMSSDMKKRKSFFPNELCSRKEFWQTFKNFNGGELVKGSSSFEEIVESLKEMIRRAFDAEMNPISVSDARKNEELLLEQARRLLERGVDPNILDMKHWTALHHACEFVLPKQLTWRQQRLAPRPAPCQDPTSDGVIRESSDEQNMEEFYVKMAIDKVEELLKKKANINAQSLDGKTPLHCAVRSGCKELVIHLLNRDADRTLADVHGHTPFHLAAIGNNTGMLLSLRLKADDFTNGPRDVAGRTALHLAAIAGSIDAMDTLLDLVGVRDGASDNKRRTPLHLASLFGKDEAVKILLARGEFNLSAKDDEGRAPIHLGALSNATDAVKLLMEHEGKFHEPQHNPAWFTDLVSFSKDSNQQTPFHLAAKGGNINVLVVMVQEIKRMNVPGDVFRRALLQQDINGETALMVAMGERKIQPANHFLALETDGPNGLQEDLL
ncbi:hypothetical protein CKAH01_18545 [Colletotrichum kahawae]|uniref:Ankyrin repeat protein n=1 Tax=Colletotrichum kahawae TaxID=34407 RepID=A0AAD9Y777_COLKA|nr:hypothetical protein CKAH01_18545 [Colletotrichum kahawae]